MSSKVFITQYPFTCGCCQQEFPAGTAAYYDDRSVLRNADGEHEWAGEAIQIDAHGQEAGFRIRDTMPHGKTAQDRCDRCFIIHASGQTECY